MSVHENDPVRARQPGQVVAASSELLWPLAIGRAFLGDRLIEAHRRSAAAMSEEDYFRDPGLFPEELYAGLHIEGDIFPHHRRLVVVETRVHCEDQKPSLR